MKAQTGLTAGGSVVLAFLASQHHTLHMLLFTAGVGGAGMGFMTAFPLIRRAMLLLSLLMTGWTVYQLWRRRPHGAMRVLGGLSPAASLALVAWSMLQYGV